MAVFQSKIYASPGTIFGPGAFEPRIGKHTSFHGYDAIVQGAVVIDGGEAALVTIEVPGVNSEAILPTANV